MSTSKTYCVQTHLQLWGRRKQYRCPPRFESCRCTDLRAKFGRFLFSGHRLHLRPDQQEAKWKKRGGGGWEESIRAVKSCIGSIFESQTVEILSKLSAYHHTFVVLPLRVKVDDSVVYGPDECDVQHGVKRGRTAENHLITNLDLRVFRCYCDASRL